MAAIDSIQGDGAAASGREQPTGEQDATATPGVSPISNTILSEAVSTAIEHSDAKQAMDMMLVHSHVTEIERENHALQQDTQALRVTLAAQTQETSEMYRYLHEQLDTHVARIEMMEQEVASAHTECAHMRREHAAAMTQMQVDYTLQLQQARARETSLQDELEQLHAFAQHKQQIEQTVQDLQHALEIKTLEYEQDKSAWERRFVQDADRMKKDLFVRLQATKEQLLTGTQEHVSTTTKRTMLENEHFVAELAFQSREAEQLHSKYCELEQEVKQLRLKTHVLEANEVVLARKTRYYQKILHQLEKDGPTEPTAASMEAILDVDESSEETTMQLEHDLAAKQHEVDALTAKIATLRASLQNAQQWLTAFQQEKQFLVAQQDEIIQFLVRALQEVPQELAADSARSVALQATSLTTMAQLMQQMPSFQALDELSSEDTRRALQFLLEKMRHYQQQTATIYLTANDSNAATTHRRALLAKQLGVELPPIISNAPVHMGSDLSPLKAKRRVLLSSAIANADGSNQKPKEPSSTMLVGASSVLSSMDPIQQLMLVATSPITFDAASPTKTKKPPQHGRAALPSPSKSTASPCRGRGNPCTSSSLKTEKSGGGQENTTTLVSAWSTDSLPPCEATPTTATNTAINASPSRRR